MIRSGGVGADRFFSIPIALDLQTLLVQAPTAVAVAHVIGIIVLEGFFCHLDYSDLFGSQL